MVVREDLDKHRVKVGTWGRGCVMGTRVYEWINACMCVGVGVCVGVCVRVRVCVCV